MPLTYEQLTQQPNWENTLYHNYLTGQHLLANTQHPQWTLDNDTDYYTQCDLYYRLTQFTEAQKLKLIKTIIAKTQNQWIIYNYIMAHMWSRNGQRRPEERTTIKAISQLVTDPDVAAQIQDARDHRREYLTTGENMPQPHWYIEKPGNNQQDHDNYRRLIQTLDHQDTPHHEYRPPHETTPTTEDRPIIVIGSIATTKQVQKLTPWIPGVWADYNQLRCQHYYAHYGPHLLQQNYLILPLAEIERRHHQIYHQLSNHNELFIRPDDNAKTYPGELVHHDNFQKWYQLTTEHYQVKPETLSIASQPANLKAEYRLIIADQKPIAASVYQPTITTGAPGEVWNYAQKLAQIWGPHPIYVMDIAELNTDHPDRYRLLEIGSINAAGLYASDLEPIVNSINKIAEREWLENQ